MKTAAAATFRWPSGSSTTAPSTKRRCRWSCEDTRPPSTRSLSLPTAGSWPHSTRKAIWSSGPPRYLDRAPTTVDSAYSGDHRHWEMELDFDVNVDRLDRPGKWCSKLRRRPSPASAWTVCRGTLPAAVWPFPTKPRTFMSISPKRVLSV